MCDPISAATMAIMSVASTAVSLVGQSEMADAQNHSIEQQKAQADAQVAKQEAADENDQLRAARREQGRMEVAAGESGLSLGSGSVEQMLMNNQQQVGLNQGRIQLNARNQYEEIASDASRAYSQVSKPTLLGAGLQLAMAGYTGFKQGQSLQIQRDGMSRAAASQVTV